MAERLAAIAGTDGQVSAEVRTETEGLLREQTDLETRYRAALAAESAEAEKRNAQALNAPNVAPDRELAEVRSRSSLANFARAASRNVQVDGAEAELREALMPGQDHTDRVPLAMLAVPRRSGSGAEERTISGYQGDYNTNWASISGVFQFPVLGRLGIAAQSVPTGQSTFQAVANEVDTTVADHNATTAAADTALTVRALNLAPTRVTARVDFQVGNTHWQAGLEEQIRRQITMSLSDKMEADALIGGRFAASAAQTYTANSEVANPLIAHANGLSGSQDSTALADAPAARITFAEMVGQAAVLVDGYYSNTGADITILASLDAYRHAYSGDAVTTGGDELAGDILGRNSGGFLATDRLPGKASTGTTRNKVANLLAVRSAASRHAFMPVWDSFLMVRDQYSDAASGGVRLVASAFWNFGVLPVGRGGAALAAGTGVATMLAWQVDA